MFKNLFKKAKKGSLKEVKTTPLSEEELREVVKAEKPSSRNQAVVSYGRSPGKQRDHDEDALFTFSGTIAYGEKDQNLGVFVIADGMGGHQNGALASSSAARIFGKNVLEHFLLPVLDPDQNAPALSIQEIMENAVNSAHLAVQKNAPGGGTTLTAALVIGEQFIVAHVGDSRSYYIHMDGRYDVLTQDHSLVHRLVELGQLDEEMAKAHPQRNVLYRALGQSDPFVPDIASHQITRPGYLLLCSDGLWGVVSNDEIVKIVLEKKMPSKACEALVDAANQAGGPDNISVILVLFS